MNRKNLHFAVLNYPISPRNIFLLITSSELVSSFTPTLDCAIAHSEIPEFFHFVFAFCRCQIPNKNESYSTDVYECVVAEKLCLSVTRNEELGQVSFHISSILYVVNTHTLLSPQLKWIVVAAAVAVAAVNAGDACKRITYVEVMRQHASGSSQTHK